MIVFDMDGTLLDGRTIFHLAEKKGFTDILNEILGEAIQPYKKTIKIAKLLNGISKSDIIDIFHEILFRPNVVEVVSELKKKGFILAVATDSYDVVAEDVKRRLGFHHAFANNLIFKEGICNGEIKLHNKGLTEDNITNKIYSINKSDVIETLSKIYNIPISNIISVGDGVVDSGMLKKAGLGIAAFASDDVNKYADVVTDDLTVLLTLLNR